jgi:hypothetical protein
VAAEQRVRGSVVGVESLCGGWTRSQVVVELTHTPLHFLTSFTGLIQIYCGSPLQQSRSINWTVVTNKTGRLTCDQDGTALTHRDRDTFSCVRLNALTAVKILIFVFWVETPCGLYGWLWRWKQYVPPKRWYQRTSMYIVTTEKTNIDISFILATIRWALYTK